MSIIQTELGQDGLKERDLEQADGLIGLNISVHHRLGVAELGPEADIFRDHRWACRCSITRAGKLLEVNASRCLVHSVWKSSKGVPRPTPLQRRGGGSEGKMLLSIQEATVVLQLLVQA